MFDAETDSFLVNLRQIINKFTKTQQHYANNSKQNKIPVLLDKLDPEMNLQEFLPFQSVYKISPIGEVMNCI